MNNGECDVLREAREGRARAEKALADAKRIIDESKPEIVRVDDIERECDIRITGPCKVFVGSPGKPPSIEIGDACNFEIKVKPEEKPEPAPPVDLPKCPCNVPVPEPPVEPKSIEYTAHVHGDGSADVEITSQTHGGTDFGNDSSEFTPARGRRLCSNALQGISSAFFFVQAWPGIGVSATTTEMTLAEYAEWCVSVAAYNTHFSEPAIRARREGRAMGQSPLCEDAGRT